MIKTDDTIIIQHFQQFWHYIIIFKMNFNYSYTNKKTIRNTDYVQKLNSKIEALVNEKNRSFRNF